MKSLSIFVVAALLSSSSAISVKSFKDEVKLTDEELMDPKTYKFVSESIDKIDGEFKKCQNEDKALGKKYKKPEDECKGERQMVHKTHDKLEGLVSKWVNVVESQSVGLKEDQAGKVKVTADHIASVLAVDKAINEIQKFEKAMLGEPIEEKSFDEAQKKITTIDDLKKADEKTVKAKDE